MKNITQAQVKQAIDNFLQSQYDKKTESIQKKLVKAEESKDFADISELQSQLGPFKEKFNKVNWMIEAKTMATQLNFGTHISKGVHPNAKGDNVNFRSQPQHDFMGTHSLISGLMDANGNAAALPLAGLFDWTITRDGVTDGASADHKSPKLTVRDLLLTNHPALSGSFAEEQTLSDVYQQVFVSTLTRQIDNPSTHERNKQLLWPLECSEDSITATTTADYHTIIPLYPSVLTHELFRHINHLKFSEENKLARDNRHKKTAEQQPYITIHDLAVLQLGGTKPQNISKLISKQSGRNYLLPSLPPSFTQSQDLSFSKNASSIFNSKTMAYKTRKTLDALYKIIKTNYNNVTIRDTRKSLLDELLLQILTVANSVQNNRPAGWSAEYQLDYAEKLWLDPYRKELMDEDTFKTDFDNGYWQQEIEQRFAAWLQNLLKKEFPKIKDDFADAEQTQWENEMQAALKESKRMGQGAFK
ncbi:type I-F CRISPR-associated protein Csy1 [Psychrobacter sp. LV10R520-6]|uniref:type I-F CRISPR-associated protein Csy1 n=1 Tax=Psychrobacter sp. LV10R520-6 TaxID=1415574 RepID=UPI0024C8A712|nr:type I-F CRISPR-associated protein Csy1 [Psychrobacter sp. LV10R520-6]SNT69674.1 CRISPR-associated protein Csy1 [Psychrobacter sp. LV10R520-6]